MRKLRLKLDDLHVESFTPGKAGGEAGSVRAMQYTHLEGGQACTTHSLNYATHCECSGGPRCTLECVEYSQATDVQACCG